MLNYIHLHTHTHIYTLIHTYMHAHNITLSYVRQSKILIYQPLMKFFQTKQKMNYKQNEHIQGYSLLG